MACGGSLSPNNLIAAGGFLQNTGIGLASPVSRAVETLNTTATSSAFQSALTAANSMGVTSVVSGVGSSILPGVAGNIPSAFQGTLGSGLQSVPLLDHTSNILGNGDLSGMFSNFNQSLGFSITSESFLSSVTEANIPFGNHANGIIGNMNDWVTGGLSGLGDLPKLGFDLKALGSLGNISNIANLGSVTGFAETLINNGLGETTGLIDELTRNGIPLDQLNNLLYTDQISQIMNNLGGSDIINQVKDQFGAEIGGIETLADFTNFEKMFPTSIDTLNFTNLDEFSTGLASIGNFSGVPDTQTLGELVSSMENITDQDKLMELSRFVDNETVNQISNVFPNGTGEFGSLNISDMIGTVAGFGIDTTMQAAADFAKELGTNGTLDNFVTRMGNIVELEAGDYDIIDIDGSTILYQLPDALGTFPTYETAAAAIVSNAEENLAVVRDTVPDAKTLLNDSYLAISEKIVSEKANLSAANINLTQFAPNDVLGKLNFAGRLGNLGQDTREGSVSEFIERTATDNIFGQGVVASLAEGRNRSRISMAGVRNQDLFGGQQRTTITGNNSTIVVTLDGRNMGYQITSGSTNQAQEDLERLIEANETQLQTWRVAVTERDESNYPRTTTQIARVQEQTDLYNRVLSRISNQNGSTNSLDFPA